MKVFQRSIWKSILESDPQAWSTLFYDDFRPYVGNELVKIGPSAVLKIFEPYLTAQRKFKIEQVLKKRTSAISIVLDGLYNPGNRNAIIRTVESFGHNWLHSIEQDSMKLINRTTQGADQWINVAQWRDRNNLIDLLKTKNIKIITASLSPASIPLEELQITHPSVVILGNEALGPSGEFEEASDFSVKIDTVGMTQSFNVSVAAAIISWEIYKKMSLHSEKLQFPLSPEEELTTKAYYYLRSVPGRLRDQLLSEKFLSK
jgi:tRNA (guanosine-2'-O-)-methyltransferase